MRLRLRQEILGIDISEGTWEYENGLTDEHAADWERRLEAVGRVPFILFPLICGRCGQLWPDSFHAPTEEWERYIPISERRLILCLACYQEIKGLIDRNRTPKNGRNAAGIAGGPGAAADSPAKT